jgi:hypothetical protein
MIENLIIKLTSVLHKDKIFCLNIFTFYNFINTHFHQVTILSIVFFYLISINYIVNYIIDIINGLTFL